MKVAPRDLARFLPKAHAALFYGPDRGLVRERAIELVARIAGDAGDPFRVAEITPAQIKEDPAILADEAQALSLSGGRRVLRLREVGDKEAAALGELLQGAAPAAFLVLEAGDLGKSSSLRKLFEKLPSAACVACYLDDQKTLRQLIEDWQRDHGLKADRGAVEFLIAHLGGDRGVTRQELDKLALHAGPGAARVTLADAEAVIADSSALTLEDLALALGDGDIAAVDRAYGRALAEGSDESGILRAVARHFLRLHQVAGADDRDAAVASLWPPLFWKNRERFLDQLRLWPQDRLAAALGRLTEAEIQVKTSGQPRTALAGRALQEVAAMARRRPAIAR